MKPRVQPFHLPEAEQGYSVGVDDGVGCRMLGGPRAPPRKLRAPTVPGPLRSTCVHAAAPWVAVRTWITATRRIGPAHRGQRRTSIAYAHFIGIAHSSRRWRLGSSAPTRSSPSPRVRTEEPPYTAMPCALADGGRQGLPRVMSTLRPAGRPRREQEDLARRDDRQLDVESRDHAQHVRLDCDDGLRVLRSCDLARTPFSIQRRAQQRVDGRARPPSGARPSSRTDR